MNNQKNKYPRIYRIGIWLFLSIGIILVVGYSRLDQNSGAEKLPVRVILESGKTVLTYTQGISSKTIKSIKRACRKKSDEAVSITIFSRLFIEKTDHYSWRIDYSRPVVLWIDNKPVIDSSNPSNSGHVYLIEGFRDFKLEIPLIMGLEDRLRLYWKHSGLMKWKPMRQDFFIAPQTDIHTSKEALRLQEQSKLIHIIQQGLTFLFVTLFLYLGLVLTRKHTSTLPLFGKSGSLAIEKMNFKVESYKRIIGIDITKGVAALLMILGHSSGANLMLPFAAFGADLFFFCSGMNTYLFLKRTKKRRGITLYYLFFTVLLFVGGYTHIVIAHPGEKRLIPEFFQLIALGMLFIFLLMKMLRNTRLIGYLFFVPFLLHFSYKFNWLPFLHSNTHWRTFVFGETGFALFPWAGFLFYGIFILNLRKNHKAIAALLLVSAISSVVLIVVAGIPVTRYDMSLSYMALSLFALTFLFYVFDRMTLAGLRIVPAIFQNYLALVGRNSLMFVYLHYLILQYLVPRVPDFSAVVELLIQGLIAFVFCMFFIFIYEKIKFDDSLFFPMLIFLIFLLTSRYGGLFVANIDFNLIDLVTGIVFTFIYIELRRKFRVWVKPVLSKSCNIHELEE